MRLRLFYGCSYMLHLSGDNSRNLFSHLLLSKLFCSDTFHLGCRGVVRHDGVVGEDR